MVPQEFAKHKVGKIDGKITDDLETQADGVGGAITLFEASLTDGGTIKQEVQNARRFMAEIGLEGMDVGAKILKSNECPRCYSNGTKIACGRTH